MGLLTPQWLIQNFKYAVLVIFILAAVLTASPDPVNQIIMAGPMLALYGLSILIAWVFGKKLLMGQVSEHLIPLWSYGKLPRFRLGRAFRCPSAPGGPLPGMCPAQGRCTGTFPGTVGLPDTCWFQASLAMRLSLSPDRIGVVRGEYGSEQEVRMHGWG